MGANNANHLAAGTCALLLMVSLSLMMFMVQGQVGYARRAFLTYMDKCYRQSRLINMSCRGLLKQAQNGSSTIKLKPNSYCCKRLRETSRACRCIYRQPGANHEKVLNFVDTNEQIATTCNVKPNTNCSAAITLYNRQSDPSSRPWEPEYLKKVCGSTVENAKTGSPLDGAEWDECCIVLRSLGTQWEFLCPIKQKREPNLTKEFYDFFNYIRANITCANVINDVDCDMLDRANEAKRRDNERKKDPCEGVRGNCQWAFNTQSLTG